jgi:hypothetical protein
MWTFDCAASDCCLVIPCSQQIAGTLVPSSCLFGQRPAFAAAHHALQDTEVGNGSSVQVPFPCPPGTLLNNDSVSTILTPEKCCLVSHFGAAPVQLVGQQLSPVFLHYQHLFRKLILNKPSRGFKCLSWHRQQSCPAVTHASNILVISTYHIFGKLELASSPSQSAFVSVTVQT